jgi:microcin C transport system permease protein
MSDERAGFRQRQSFDAKGRPKGWLSPTNRRRWANFKANRRGYWSLWIFMILFIASLLAEFIANDRPILASYKGEILYPVLVDYPEEKFGGFWRAPTIATRSSRRRSRPMAG